MPCAFSSLIQLRRLVFHGTITFMTPVPRLQYTSVRTRIVDGKPLIGLKHTAKVAAGLPVSTAWVEMPPEDVERLIKSLQETLAELGKELPPN